MNPINSLRVSPLVYTDEARWHQLAGLLKGYRNAIQEVAFFTGFTHPPLPLAVIEDRARILVKKISAVRELDLRVGINHLATMGHLDENLDNSLNEPWQHLVDIHGGVSASCYCPFDPDFRQYVRQSYIALSATGPDFIWVDDDVRLESHPRAIRLACFCPRCLAIFSRLSGQTWNRAELASALGSDDPQSNILLRRRWLDFNRGSIAGLLACVRAAVDEVNPGIKLGYMTGEMAYSGYGHADWAVALAGPKQIEVKWRPGGGFYEDSTPGGLLFKAHSVGRQISCLPGDITDIQYEHENFPYQRLRKSGVIFKAEIAAAIAAGCSGTALNVIGISSDPLDEYLPWLDGFQECSPFFRQEAEVFGRSLCEGVGPAWTQDFYAALNSKGSWREALEWGGSWFARFDELSEIGLPPAYSQSGATVSLLSAENSLSLTTPQLLNILSGGVVVDGPAMEELVRRGLGEHLGFRLRGIKEHDTIEKFTTDPLNDRFVGWTRDCRPSFWGEKTYLLDPFPGARAISEVTDFVSRMHGICAGVYENKLGGRVAVLGYFPWRSFHTLAKSAQMKALMRWLSRDRLPAYINSYTRAALWCRRDSRGRLALLLLNTSLDQAATVDLLLRESAADYILTRMDGQRQFMKAQDHDGIYRRLAVPGLSAWEPVLIQAG